MAGELFLDAGCGSKRCVARDFVEIPIAVPNGGVILYRGGIDEDYAGELTTRGAWPLSRETCPAAFPPNRHPTELPLRGQE